MIYLGNLKHMLTLYSVFLKKERAVDVKCFCKTVIVSPVKTMKIYCKHSTHQEETEVEGREMRWKAEKKQEK